MQMKTVVCRIDLGYTRIAGYTLFDEETLDFEETTPKEVESLLKRGKINGLVFDSKGDIVPDLEGWNLGNIKIKSGVGNYRNFNTDSPKGDTVYSVIRVVEVEGIGRIYETINNRCARVFFSEKQMLALIQFSWVGGMKFNEESNEITICKGVKTDKSDNGIFELGTKVLTKEQLQEAVMKELFNGNSAAQVETVAEVEADKPTEAGLPFESNTAMQPVSEGTPVATDTEVLGEQEENSPPATLEQVAAVASNECTEEVTENTEELKGETVEPVKPVEPVVETAPEETAVAETVAEPESEDEEQNWQPKTSYKNSGSKISKKKR